MDWLLYALLAPAIYATVIFVDRYIVRGGGVDFRGVVLFGGVMGLLFGTAFWMLSGFPLLQGRDAALVIASGMCSIAASAFYFKAIYREAASRVIIFLQMIPVMVLALSYIFLGEVITLRQFSGFTLILAAAVGLALVSRREKESLRVSIYSFVLVLLSASLWAAANVIFKFVVDHTSFSKIVAYESWGMFLGGALIFALFPEIRKAFLGNLRTIPTATLGVIFINEGIFVLAKLLMFFAISLGPVTLVSVLGSTQVFFGILYGWLLNLVAPSVFDEDVSARGLLRQVAFAVVMVFGVWLLQ